MSETENISKMAKKISDEIFSKFGWTKVGPENTNWPCENTNHKGPTGADTKTHPSDVVFFYDDPYEDRRVYVNTDLKSYAAGTITKATISGAVRGIIKAVQCANAGNEWRQKYLTREGDWRCDGMLFTYNHDGEFTSEFADLLKQVEGDVYEVPHGLRVAVFGPKDVCRLNDVATDMNYLRTRESNPWPARDQCEFVYPDLVLSKRVDNKSNAATLEMLTGPWVIMRVKAAQRFVIWYHGPGQSPDEFKYLIDYLFRYQVLNSTDETSVEIRLTGAIAAATAHFDRARIEYSTVLQNFADHRLKGVTCEPITNFVRAFSQIAIGMEQRG